MTDISELKQRINAALDRIENGLDGLAAPGLPMDGNELARLRQELEEERAAKAQLEDQVKTLNARLEEQAEALETERAKMVSELQALRSLRDADRTELDGILNALEPLLQGGGNA